MNNSHLRIHKVKVSRIQPYDKHDERDQKKMIKNYNVNGK